MVKEYLSQRSIGFEERDVSQNPAYGQELMRSSGQMGVLVTIIKGQIVVGFDRGRLDQLLTQSPKRQRLLYGASIADASKITAKQGSGIILGAYVGSVRPGSVAARIGLVPGDIITELSVRNIANASDLEQAIANMDNGARFSLSFIRGNKTMTSEGAF
jgi:S1-C subfamily serine protease